MDNQESLKVALAVLQDNVKQVMTMAGENKQTMQFLLNTNMQISQILNLLDQGQKV